MVLKVINKINKRLMCFYRKNRFSNYYVTLCCNLILIMCVPLCILAQTTDKSQNYKYICLNLNSRAHIVLFESDKIN